MLRGLICFATKGWVSVIIPENMSEGELHAAIQVMDNFAKVTGFHPIRRLQEYFEDVLSTLSDLLEKYNSLKFAEIKNQRELTILHDRLKDAADAVFKYADCVYDLYSYASDEESIKEIKEGIEGGDFTPLTEFIMQMIKVYLEPAEQSCQVAEEKLKEVRSSALDLATDCKMKAQEAKSSRQIATIRARKSTVVGVALVVFSLVVFGFTIGTGTLFVVAVFGLQHIVAERDASTNSKECEREFRELSQKFCKVMTSASSMFDYTRHIKMYLESLSRKINIINQSKEVHEARSCRKLSLAFDRLCRKFRDLHTPVYREALRAIDTEFQDRLEQIFCDLIKCSGDG